MNLLLDCHVLPPSLLYSTFFIALPPSSVCLLVTVMEFVVCVAVGAVFVGAVLSIFATIVFSEDIFPTLSTTLNLSVTSLFTVYVIAPF